MLWLTWVALSLAAPTATETPTVRLPVPLPAGVTSSLVARELATKPRGATVTFALDGKPELRDGRLVVRGVLANAGSREAVVYLVSAPHTGGPFLLQPRGATFRPAPPSPDRPPIPEQPPAPEELVLPAGARVVYESALVVGSWTWPEGGAEIDWSFQFWTDPVHGTLPGRLSPK